MSGSKQVLAFDRLDLKRSGILGPNGKPLVYDSKSLFRHAGVRQFKTVTCVGTTMPTTAFNGTGKQSFAFDRNQFNIARNLILRFRIDVTSASVRLVPTFWWCFYFTISSLGENTQELQRFHPEGLMALFAAMGTDYVESMAEAIGFNPKSLWLTRQVASGESVYMYLPIPAWFMFGQAGWSGKTDQSSQIQFDFYPVGSIISSGSGTVSLGEAVLLVDSDYGAPGDIASLGSLTSQYSVGSNYLTCETANLQSQVINHSNTYTFNLQNLSHKTAGLIVGFLLSTNTNSNTASATQQYQSLGDGYSSNSSPGTLDITDPGSMSLYGGGQAIPAYHLKGLLGARQGFCAAFNRYVNLYPILFCSELRAALGAGQIDDFFSFNKTAYQLSLRTPNTGTSEVHTITQSGQSATGDIKLGWTSLTTGITSWTNDLICSTSAANLGVAFNALESVIQDRLVCTFNAAFSAGTTVTCTFTDVGLQAVDLKGNIIQCVANTLATSAPAAVNLSVARTTQGISGWVDGTYTPVVIALYWKTMVKYSMGGSGLIRITDA